MKAAQLTVWVVAALLAGCAGNVVVEKPEGLVTVYASAETRPMERAGDAADDPVIWLHPADSSQSLIIGTQKRGGLRVYDLRGRLVQRLDIGAPNNVDLRYGVVTATGSRIDLLAASNREFNGVSLLAINPRNRLLRNVAAAEESTDLLQIYGICMGQRGEETFVYANSRDGTIYHYRVVAENANRVALERVRVLKIPTQVEGCVVDDRSGQLFVNEEDAGLWKFGAWPEDSVDGSVIVRVGEYGLADDLEGVTLAHTRNGGHLVLSSQGNSTYGVFDLISPHAYRGSFQVGDIRAQDGTSYTDGLDILASAVGQYANGLAVIQDGKNTRPRENQNFKLVDWGEVARALNLETWPEFDPRRQE
ncbi:MAG: phytase [Xanthomonadales bacterium]|nr:phytase [Xanthomonadales bacterium]